MLRVLVLMILAMVISGCACGGCSGSGSGESSQRSQGCGPPLAYTVPAFAQLKPFSPNSKTLPTDDNETVSLDVCVSDTRNVLVKTFTVEQGQSDGSFGALAGTWTWPEATSDTARIQMTTDGTDKCARIHAPAKYWKEAGGNPIPFRVRLNSVEIRGVENFSLPLP